MDDNVTHANSILPTTKNAGVKQTFLVTDRGRCGSQRVSQTEGFPACVVGDGELSGKWCRCNSETATPGVTATILLRMREMTVIQCFDRCDV